MIRYIRTKLSTQEVLKDEIVSDNWWCVYKDIARYDGRRIHYYGDNKMEVIFTEKNYAITLIR